jgi:uncharacterized protein (TIGR02996 family)
VSARLDDKLGVYLERPPVSATERKLIDAVVAAPDDRGPRLVYADYLLSRGEPELHARGELNVTQCRLDELLADAPAELRSREHELLDRYGRTWTSWIGLRGPRWNVEFRGGFMERVDVHATNVIGVAARLFKTEPVRRLVVEEAGRQLERLGDVVWLQKLHTFGLRSAYYDARTIAAVLSSPHLRHVRGLVLERDRLVDIALDHLAELCELAVAHNQIASVRSFARLPLHALDLSYNPLADDSVGVLLAMPLLERLDVRGAPLSQTAVARLRDRFGRNLLA